MKKIEAAIAVAGAALKEASAKIGVQGMTI